MKQNIKYNKKVIDISTEFMKMSNLDRKQDIKETNDCSPSGDVQTLKHILKTLVALQPIFECKV